MGKLLSIITDVIFKICFYLADRLLPWFFERAFYFCLGLLLMNLAPKVHADINILMAFGIGVGIAATLDWLLSSSFKNVLYKQILFGTTGFVAGLSLNMGIFPALALAALSVWQSQRS